MAENLEGDVWYSRKAQEEACCQRISLCMREGALVECSESLTISETVQIWEIPLFSSLISSIFPHLFAFLKPSLILPPIPFEINTKETNDKKDYIFVKNPLILNS